MATAGIYDDNYPDSASDVGDDETERATTDGYFERRTHPRETFKQNPGISPAEAKAREAAEQQARFGRGRGETSAANRDRPVSRASSAASSSILTPSSARARSPAREASERIPLLDADQAPPSYSDATAGRAYRPEQRMGQEPSVGNYGSIPASARAEAMRGIEEGRQAIAAGRREAERGIEEGRRAMAAGRREAEQSIEEGRRASAASARRASAAAAGRDNYEFYWPFGNRGNPFKHNGPWGHYGPFGPHGWWGGEGADESSRDETSRESRGDPHRGHRGRGRGHGRRWDHRRWRQWHEWHNHDEEGNPVHDFRKNARSCSGKQRWRERCCQPRHICNWILAGLIIFLVIMIGWIAKGESEKYKTPTSPSSPSEPFPRDPYLQHRSTSHCYFEHSSAVYIETFKFSNKQNSNFTLLELIEPSPAAYFGQGISGTVSIVPAPSEQTEDMVFIMHMATTMGWEVSKPDLVILGSAIEIRAPSLTRIDGQRGLRPSCLDVAVKISIRKDVVFSNFEVAALNLDVVSAGSLFKHGETEDWDGGLTITNVTTISAIRGHVHLAFWASREIYISSISGSVQGTYALKDVLSVTTKSGSIDIGVSPHDVDKDHPKPAKLKIDTISGSVQTHWVTLHDLPDRDYRCTVSSKSSSIQGSYMLGSLTSLTTLSGHITVDILPHDAGQKRAQLKTSSHSGSTYINLLEPYQANHFPHFWKDYASTSAKASKTDVLARLSSSHESNSGSLKLLYPPAWVGSFSGHTLSGSVKIRGKDVEMDPAADLPLWRYFEGRKGIGSSKLKFLTTSGSVYLAIGET